MPATIFEIFEVELQNTLNHLYEPVYLPEACIFDVLDTSTAEGMEGVRRKIIEAIDEMGRADYIPETTKIHFLFRVLQQRFVFSQSQEKAAVAVEISPRHFRRKQNEAVHCLALQLWKKWQGKQARAAETDGDKTVPAERAADSADSTGSSWTATILSEIAVLNQRSLGITTDVPKVIQRTLEMIAHLPSTNSIRVEVTEIDPDLQIPIHPNVLRQVFLFVIQQIVQSGYTGQVQIKALGRADTTVITFITCQDADAKQIEMTYIQELAAILGGKVEIIQDQQSCALDLIFPKSENVTVLVVDDNFEVERLYRQFTANTRYKIFYQSSGADLAGQIRKINPDILVIDVLLPGLDGWDLLVELRQDPLTMGLPVIVSSVMGSSEIARSLGANGYLPKPFERKLLLQALQEAVGVV